MNEEKYNATRIKELLENATSIAIVPSEVSGADALSAAAGLYYSLSQQDKDVSLVYIADVPEICKNIITTGQITDDIYSRKLNISIDYSDTPASKLAYSNEHNILKLVLSPISKEFDTSKIKTEIKGHDFDLIFVLGAQSPEDLGTVGSELRDTFIKAKIVNLDNTNLNTQHGDVNIVDTLAPNLSAIVFKLLSMLGILPDAKASKALLLGMSYREPSA
jgi:nanoRNase/pAp phosphatase (c-di-AMP/oligoRNAs hydrolase)